MPEEQAIDWKALAQELYEHLEYCGWGDSWERECSEELRARADAAMETIKC